MVQTKLFIDRINKMSMDFYSKLLENHKKVERELQIKNDALETLQKKYDDVTESVVKLKERDLRFNKFLKKIRHKMKQRNLEDENLDLNALQMDDSALLSYIQKKSQDEEQGIRHYSQMDLKELTFKNESAHNVFVPESTFGSDKPSKIPKQALGMDNDFASNDMDSLLDKLHNNE